MAVRVSEGLGSAGFGLRKVLPPETPVSRILLLAFTLPADTRTQVTWHGQTLNREEATAL